MYRWLDRLRIWLWQRQVRALECAIRPTGTTEGDGIVATVTGSMNSSGHGAGATSGIGMPLP